MLEIEDRPGALGEIARRLGEARVNLTLVYLATNTRVVLAADNLADAKSADQLSASSCAWIASSLRLGLLDHVGGFAAGLFGLAIGLVGRAQVRARPP